MLIILAGSASLERKNKLQVPKREFSPQPQDRPSSWRQLQCPMCAWEGFSEARELQIGRVLGPLVESARDSEHKYRVVSTYENKT